MAITKPIPDNPLVPEGKFRKIVSDLQRKGVNGANAALEQPPSLIVAADNVCWRCNGVGSIKFSKTERTPCGACLGTGEQPKPCPKCKSRKVKLASAGGPYTFWRCRDCGFQGPGSPQDYNALKLWEELPRDGA